VDGHGTTGTPLGWVVLGIVAALAAVVVILVVGHDRSLQPLHPVGDVAATGHRAPASADQQILASVGLGPDDVGPGYSVELIDNGDLLSDPTLDFCGLHFASEQRREARRQVAASDSSGDPLLDTESVLYDDQVSAAEAMGEVRGVGARCPSTPVEGPLASDPEVVWHVRAASQAGWPQVAGIDRVALDVTLDVAGEPPEDQLVVYLRRGRLLMGVYLASDAPEVSVGGQSSMSGVLDVFEQRKAALPPADVE
jgi:hypothetical protein